MGIRRGSENFLLPREFRSLEISLSWGLTVIQSWIFFLFQDRRSHGIKSFQAICDRNQVRRLCFILKTLEDTTEAKKNSLNVKAALAHLPSTKASVHYIRVDPVTLD